MQAVQIIIIKREIAKIYFTNPDVTACGRLVTNIYKLTINVFTFDAFKKVSKISAVHQT